MYISLGSDCVTKKRIEEIKFDGEKQKSNIFDWVLIDLKAINFILKHGIHVFNTDNWYVVCKRTQDDKYIIRNKLCYFVSLHDADSNLSEEEAILKISEMYVRRFNRLIEILRSDEEIQFVGTYDKLNPIQEGDMVITILDIENFIKNINMYRENNFNILLILSDYSHLILPNALPLNVKIINSNEYILKDWYRFHFDWNQIMEKI